MTRPRLLDLFCKEGGAALGYARAGFEVVGIDIEPQSRYPFEFHKADAMRVLSDLELAGIDRVLGSFEAIHASPPCQAYSVTRHSHGKEHPDLVAPVRALLTAIGLPYVIENVVGAPLVEPLELCGSMFGLEATDLDGQRLYLRRHRLFESNVLLMAPGSGCRCSEPRRAGLMCGGVYGAGPSNRSKAPWKGYGHRRGGYTPPQSVRAELMGIDWMTQAGLSQAIPPAYTEHIGSQLLAALERAA